MNIRQEANLIKELKLGFDLLQKDIPDNLDNGRHQISI